MSDSLTHFDEDARPRMVDVSAKTVTARSATAVGRVRFPAAAWARLEADGFATKKGPIATVATVAGTMAVKRTADLIPFCHPLPVDGCSFAINPIGGQPVIEVRCTVKTTGRTGVEMEALTGVTAAALTIYDMTKALSHEIEIEAIHLLAKAGGKSDFTREV